MTDDDKMGTTSVGPDSAKAAGVDWQWIVSWLSRWILPLYFALFAAGMAAFFIGHGLLGIDGRIYARAAASWLSGGDPWRASVAGYFFAAPPPTLLPFVPFAVLGETLSAILWVSGSLIAGFYVIRQLRLPPWWILFPPLVNGVLAGNADVVLVALLLSGGTVGAVVASFLKIYAVVPMVGDRRWRDLVLTATALVVTIPILPWGTFVAQSGQIADTLARQAVGISAWGSPLVIVGAVLALARLGPILASWLAVPALWPSSQLHYSTLALPALARARVTPAAALIAAMLFAPENRWFPALAVMVLAIGAILQRRRDAVGLTLAVGAIRATQAHDLP